MEVNVYTTPSCGYCHQVKEYLRERGISFREFDVSRDREAAEQMVALTGQMGVPVITIDGRW
jgi:glutaredoxin-like YruB-family protein